MWSVIYVYRCACLVKIKDDLQVTPSEIEEKQNRYPGIHIKTYSRLNL